MANKKRKKAGLPPGSVIFTGKRKVDKINIHYLQFNETEIQEQVLDNRSITDFHKPVEEYVQWYDLRGLHDTVLIEEIGKVFSVHPLALEDIADTAQRPKMDEYESGIFITFRAFSFNSADWKVHFEQLALYLGKGFVLSFQENADDLFFSIRDRLHKGGGRVRKRGADYLTYTLLDAVIDRYYLVLDEIEAAIEDLEKAITETASNENRGRIYDLKQEMLLIRKSVIPLRELTRGLLDSENNLIQESTELYIRDLRDHVVQIVDLIETYRDNLNSLQDLYLSELSYRMNSVMQVLTIVSTIFIPLTFLAGIYGMNFENMPELHWKNAYFILLGLMAVIALFLFWFFRKNKWL